MAENPPQPFIARFEDKIVHNQKFIEYHFELEEPHRLTFQAGQYVSIKIDEIGTRRSYSICSSPSIDHGFQFLLDISPAGIGTQYLESLQYGQRVNGIGPMGQFVIKDEGESSIVLIATGSGIAPIKSMALDLIEKQIAKPITLYWGMRYAADLFWLDELQDMVEANKNFFFYPVISQPEPEWNLSTGHVTDLLDIHQFPPDAGYYLCGSKQIVESIQNFLLAKSIAAEYIHHEKFF